MPLLNTLYLGSPPMKKFINASEDSVLETMSGFAFAHADLVLEVQVLA
ncbi:MAG: hypothetical protein HC933_16365 [Pleurocapsa sp. SU_196_0]|nr:hypothetical protein [Pleurocapsa sp. SU_196_0]